jgi:hypothetical protein
MTQRVTIVTPPTSGSTQETPLDIDANGNIGVVINDGVGNLGSDILTLAGDVNTLDGDVKTLNTDVNALTAAITPTSSALYTGTVSAPASGGTAVILKASQACRFVTLTAPAGNTQTVLWGASTSTCTTQLPAGTNTWEINVSNVNLIYVISSGNASQTVNWVARN